MALSEEDNQKCWRINRELNDRFFIHFVPLQEALPSLRSSLGASRNKLFELRTEEALLRAKLDAAVPRDLSLAELALFLGQFAATAPELGNINGQIAGTEAAIHEYEAQLAQVERRMAELIWQMARYWSDFDEIGCTDRYLPVGVPRIRPQER